MAQSSIQHDFIVCDAGSTKCQWAIVRSGQIVHTIESVGVNPALLSVDEIKALLPADFLRLSPRVPIYYYGAGCIGAEVNARVVHALDSVCQPSSVCVESDMLGAARATLAHDKGIVCILGTGANSCAYNGSQIVESIRPLGYILGDEGSGADIGKALVADALKGFLSADITNKFFAFASVGYAQIVENIYRHKGANAYLARFARFALDNMSDPQIADIVSARFRLFLQRNVLRYSSEYLSAEVNFVGGVANAFKDILAGECASVGLKMGRVCCRPLEGLVAYHCA